MLDLKFIRGNVGYMDWTVFKRIIAECADNDVFSVRLSWRGESMTHPQIKRMIKFATLWIRNVSFLTNAYYLDKDMCDHLIDCGLPRRAESRPL